MGVGCKLDENIISVVVPKRFKISHYESFEKKAGEYKYNKNANFKIIDNTITLYTKNVKGTYGGKLSDEQVNNSMDKANSEDLEEIASYMTSSIISKIKLDVSGASDLENWVKFVIKKEK